jgi:hypothetical protein
MRGAMHPITNMYDACVAWCLVKQQGNFTSVCVRVCVCVCVCVWFSKPTQVCSSVMTEKSRPKSENRKSFALYFYSFTYVKC